VFLGSGSFSHVKNTRQHIMFREILIIIHKIILYHTIYIYLYRGGLYRGVWAKRGVYGV
jgi:hypothetical protein